MALRLIEDFFEIGANPENITGSNWNLVSGRVSGSGAINQGGSGTWVAYPGQGWSAPIDDMYAAFALRAGANLNGVNIFSVFSDSNSVPHITLSMDASNRLVVYRGLASSGGSLLASSATPFSILTQWRSINLYFKVDSSVGRCVVKVDGVTQIDFTGNTRNASTNSNIDAIRVTIPNNAGNSFCDLVVNDATGTMNNTYPGDIACIRRLPNATGTYSEFVGSDGDSLNNYLNVDEAPSNDADYNYADVGGKRDSYNVENLPAGTLSVLGVRAVAKTAKTGAGVAGMSVFVRENGTNTFGPNVPLSTSFSWQGDALRETAPSTGVAWDLDDVDSMEIGVRSET